MISIPMLAAALRRLFDFNAETAVLEEGLQAACCGLSFASYGIPVAPVWLPQDELHARLTQPARAR